MTKKYLAITLFWATLIEGITVFARFGLKLESTRDTAATVGRLTFGLRIHHGVVGLILCVIAWFFFPRNSVWRERALILGGALAVSDFVHHFVVLWAVTGSPQFDLFYPKLH
ncbi:MAG: hypothetical protein WA705_06235 [Candidatus Ozemobacteraceae bacterium]